jgi:hypothetical protein
MTELVGVAWLLVASAEQTAQKAAVRAAAPADGARTVVAAVVRVAEDNARRPLPTDPGARAPYRRTGDELTILYIRAAAAAARRLPAEQAVPAFLLALGVALDDSEILRNNLVASAVCRRIESDAERKKRLTVLGSPTMRGRRDLCQHFVVSCALTELVGVTLAEAAGLLKEHQDSVVGSGFSFIDLCADFSGTTLAVRLQKGEIALEKLEKGFRVEDYLPDFTGLREGLTAAQFAKDYGSNDGKRFRTEVEKIRGRIRALPGHRSK